MAELGDAGIPPLPEHDSPVREGSEQADALTAANEVLSTFVTQGASLELEADGCANVEHVAARISEVTGSDGTSGCASFAPTCDGTTGSIAASFDACSLGESGTTLSGSVDVTVDTDEAGISVRLTLTDVTVTTSSASYAMTGELGTSTADLLVYTLSADLTVNDQAVTFTGSVASEQAESGALAGATFDGEGTLATGSGEEALGSWSCTGGGLSFALAGFHRAVGACRADAGTLTVQQEYACTTTVTVRGTEKEVQAEASVREVATWTESTVTTQTVHVVSTTTIGSESSESERDVTLPGECSSGA